MEITLLFRVSPAAKSGIRAQIWKIPGSPDHNQQEIISTTMSAK